MSEDLQESHDFVEVADADSLWDGEMEAYDVGDEEVLLVKLDGEIHAYDAMCPHQSISLVEGELENGVLTCRAHEWSFNAVSGASVNPVGECLARHDVRVSDDGVIQVRLRARAHASQH
jgi:nitrite reductase/ring-hydroxylating ferredoxin subunit